MPVKNNKPKTLYFEMETFIVATAVCIKTFIAKKLSYIEWYVK